MSIEKIGSGSPVTPSGDGKKIKGNGVGKNEVKDKIELSDEAMTLFASEKAKKLDEIRAKVKDNFYQTPEVKEKVVEGLMRDLKAPRQA